MKPDGICWTFQLCKRALPDGKEGEVSHLRGMDHPGVGSRGMNDTGLQALTARCQRREEPAASASKINSQWRRAIIFLLPESTQSYYIFLLFRGLKILLLKL